MSCFFVGLNLEEPEADGGHFAELGDDFPHFTLVALVRLVGRGIALSTLATTPREKRKTEKAGKSEAGEHAHDPHPDALEKE